ncbi:hypothetical protein BJ508DRAFT_410751 [Ascobolus immersus RN42]|uniref:Uncharacterized protein n=1 Tax=Ascobolus immersus RN42 TaxID=1160509 RepID=A0A3N4IM61_ASCIM|nr:hypothetical protein BJ508DRAFT_410751 [Ascobolus immersus RN42]
MSRPTFLTLPAEIHLSIFSFLTPPYSLPADASIRPASTPYNPLPNSSLDSLFYLLYALAPRIPPTSQSSSVPLSKRANAYRLYTHYTHTLFVRSFRDILMHSQRATKVLGAKLIRSFLNKTIEDIVKVQAGLAEAERVVHVEVDFWEGFWTLWLEAHPAEKSQDEQEKDAEDGWAVNTDGGKEEVVKDSEKVLVVVMRMAVKLKRRELLTSLWKMKLLKEKTPVTDQLLEEMVGKDLESLGG